MDACFRAQLKADILKKLHNCDAIIYSPALRPSEWWPDADPVYFTRSRKETLQPAANPCSSLNGLPFKEFHPKTVR